MTKDLESYLLEAEGKNREQIPSDNPYRKIGFDQDKKRLGWVRLVSFSKIRQSLEAMKPLLEGKDRFIFVGMGGSINGIKPLVSLFKAKSFYILDNLDPAALLDIIPKLNDFNKTLVIAISKSGTTKETQLLAQSLKEVFFKVLGSSQWQNHFLWLSDVVSFDKLNSLGWQKVSKVPIQFDAKTDIGGRFSSPHTLIFFLPLFLLLNKDFKKLENIYESFVCLQSDIRKKAYQEVAKYKDKENAYFSPLIEKELGESFSRWLVQLFQESLGSKISNLAVKTIPNLKESKLFYPLRLDMDIDNSVVLLMSQMYFFQIFIAYYAVFKGINFVTQEFVEEYKEQMRKLEKEGKDEVSIKLKDLKAIIPLLKERINQTQHFIEVVLYSYPDTETVTNIFGILNQEFPQKHLLIFVGSDWNHHSYQAAFKSNDTFYVLLLCASYKDEVGLVPKDIIFRNIGILKMIAQATYLTLQKKSILLAFNK